MNRKLETLLTDIFPSWALHRLQAQNKKEAAEKKPPKPTASVNVGHNVNNDRRRDWRYSDPPPW